MLEERIFEFLDKSNVMSDMTRKDLSNILCKLVADELDDKLETYLFYTLDTIKRKLGVLEKD